MGVITGLSNIRSVMESRPSSYENVSDRELTRNIAKNGERNIRFIQELDESSPLFRSEYGLGVVAVEYQHPEIYWLRITDTTDEDEGCWPKERGWDQKTSIYINVVDVDTGEVFYVGRSIWGGLGQQIIDSAQDRGTLTDGVWKIKKTGEGMKTRYSLNLINLTSDPIEVDPSALIDFGKNVLNTVPYSNQESYVRQIEQRVANKNGSVESDSSDDEDVVW